MADSSSTSSSSDRKPGGIPLLRARWIALTLLVAFAGLEWGVRVNFEPKGDLTRRLNEFDARPEAPTADIVILGTCLAEALNPDSLQDSFGSRYRVYNLATFGAYTLDWYLTAANHVLVGPDISAILILYGQYDLNMARNDHPWEAHTADLATWNDLSVATDGSLSSRHGAIDFALSRLSHSYRRRAYLANWVWYKLGTSESNLTGRQAATVTGQDLVRQSPIALKPIDREQSWVYLEQLVGLAREKGVPVMFVPMPVQGLRHRRDETTDPSYLSKLEAKINGIGGVLLDVRGEAGLRPKHFRDHVHLTGKGGKLFCAAIGRALIRQLAADP